MKPAKFNAVPDNVTSRVFMSAMVQLSPSVNVPPVQEIFGINRVPVVSVAFAVNVSREVATTTNVMPETNNALPAPEPVKAPIVSVFVHPVKFNVLYANAAPMVQGESVE
jgi:hypothetical protein